ncbi:MAG TPA: type II toxin-antitoxin system VapC family toxin [Streptosporangiaceae bacterium]|nr:type II toxin-antitoxin system VapC family toxin [Streptosporangiaceae bacterium]
MIYFDSCALLKFIKREPETDALRDWRAALPAGTELVTSELAELEVTRALLRAGVDHQRVPYFAGQALRGVYRVDVTSTVLARAKSYLTPRLGTFDSLHLASAEPFRKDLTGFVTYDKELAETAAELRFPVICPA